MMSEQAVQWIAARGLDVELAARLGIDKCKPLGGGELEWLRKSVGLTAPAECWPWLGSRRTSNGYGIAKRGKSSTTAHRVVFELFCDIPEGKVLDHLCRNRLCCNPLHLEPVTQQENTTRARRKTHCIRGHAYEGDNIMLLSKGGWRCRECHRQRELARYHRKYSPEARRHA